MSVQSIALILVALGGGKAVPEPHPDYLHRAGYMEHSGGTDYHAHQRPTVADGRSAGLATPIVPL